MEMEDQYGISDLRQFIARAATTNTPFYTQPQNQQLPLSDLMTAHHHHRGLTPSTSTTAVAQNHPFHHEMVVMGRHVGAAAAVDMLHQARGSSSGVIHQYQDHFNCDSTTTTATQLNNSSFDGGDGGAARWPRQETLTLLEIRSRLDHKFKEANQKGPLWDEVARIMCEEHGYQRSGKKCREKFENLYKYYKKTKEGKAGRQDGKHYRFFRQLEALYGDQQQQQHHNINTSTTNNPSETLHHNIVGNNIVSHFPPQGGIIPTTTHHQRPPRGCDTSVSLSNSSDFDVSSSEDDDLNGGSMESNGSMGRKKGKKRGWKAKIKEFIDLQMRKIMEKQEAWLDKMMTTLESREHERMVREEEWRKQESERVEREHKFWANERAWIEARDSALMSALQKITPPDHNNNNNNNNNNHNNDDDNDEGENQWAEPEVTRLIQLRTSMESRFQQCGFSEEVLWEDIAAKMAYLGYDRTPIICKEKWDSINKCFQEKRVINIKDDGKKKRKENYHHNNNDNHHHHHNEVGLYMNQLGGFNNCEINNESSARIQLNNNNEGSSSPSSHNSNVNHNVTSTSGNVMNDSCLRFFLGDGETLGWETNYGLKLNKGENHQC